MWHCRAVLWNTWKTTSTALSARWFQFTICCCSYLPLQVMIHQSHPLDYIAFDRTMQDIVYKLVFGIFLPNMNSLISCFLWSGALTGKGRIQTGKRFLCRKRDAVSQGSSTLCYIKALISVLICSKLTPNYFCSGSWRGAGRGGHEARRGGDCSGAWIHPRLPQVFLL